MNDAPAEAADAIVVEDAPDVAASPNAGGEDSPGSLVHQGTIIDADIAEPHHPVAPAFADEAIAPEDDAGVAPASPQSDENLDDIDGDTAVRDDPPRSSPPPPCLPSPKKTQLCLRTSRKIKISHLLTSPPSMNQPQSEASEDDRAGSGEGASGPADGTVGDAEDVEEDAEEEEDGGEATTVETIDVDDALADLTLAQRQELVELAKCV